ncbi:MAG: zinc-finger domain-containing protein [Lysobacterales bacterium]
MTHRTDAQDDSLENANTQTRVEVSRADLPFSCPQPNQKIWDAHPRVYLPIEESGEASCPYCGTHYVLKD